MKNSNDTIGSRTRDLPSCSAVPQPTAPPRTPITGFVVPRNHHHFVMSVCLSVRIEQLDSHWTDCHEILYLIIFRCREDSGFIKI
jgi:hypothetical protein